MSDEVESKPETEAQPPVDQAQSIKADQPPVKDWKAEKLAKKERRLKILLVLVLIFLGYQIFHWFEVVKEVKDPLSPNARPGRMKHMTEAELEEAEKLVRPK